MNRYNKTNKNTSSYWDEVYEDLEFDSSDTYDHIIQHIEQRPGLTVVDLGCGNGDGITRLRKKNPMVNLFGVDYSAEAIRKAKEKYPDGFWYCEDATKTSLDSRCCDIVVSSETLEHLEEPQKLIDEAYRLLVDNGLLILTTPYEDHIPSDEHVWTFDYKDLEDMLDKAGFSKRWVFPYASGRYVVNDDGSIKYPPGNWDEIMVLARR